MTKGIVMKVRLEYSFIASGHGKHVKEHKINLIFAHILLFILITFSNTVYATNFDCVPESQGSNVTNVDIDSDDIDSDNDTPFINISHDLLRPTCIVLALLSSETNSHPAWLLIQNPSIRAPPIS